MTHATIPLRRKRMRQTNYKKRLSLLAGKTQRFVVRKSLHYITAQVIGYHAQGDQIHAQAHSKELAALGYKGSAKNTPAAYLTGMLAAQRAKKAGILSAVLDSGLYPNHAGSKIYAALKGALDAGLSIPHSTDALPSEDRIIGKHIQTAKLESQITEAKKKIQAIA